jgi:hypothetical protein
MRGWNVAPMKRVELKKSINLLQIEGLFANTEITDIFGMTASTIVVEASAAPSHDAIAHR